VAKEKGGFSLGLSLLVPGDASSAISVAFLPAILIYVV